jgi:hypothetical protein
MAPVNQKISDLEKKIATTTNVSSKQKLIEEKDKLQKEKSALEKEFTKVDMSRKQKNEIDTSISKDLKEIVEELKKTDPKAQKEKFESLKNKEKGLKEELDRLDKNQVTMTRLKNVNYRQEQPFGMSDVNKFLTSISGVKPETVAPLGYGPNERRNPDRISVIPGTTMGDGSIPRPEYTDKQQERILRKAVERESQIKQENQRITEAEKYGTLDPTIESRKLAEDYINRISQTPLRGSNIPRPGEGTPFNPPDPEPHESSGEGSGERSSSS